MKRTADSKILAFVLLLMLCLPEGLFAQEIEGLFSRGNQYYGDGNYKAAIEEYKKIIDSGYESWEVYYNLGNAYFKDRQIARAILNFERAKRLNPKNEDINYNLELSNLAIVDRIQELPPFFLSKWIWNITHSISLKLLGGLAIAIYLILISLVILRIFVKSPQFKKAALISLILTGIFLISFVGFFSIRIIETETKVEAIVIRDKVDVKSGPNDSGIEFTLHEGVKIQIKDRFEDWLKIRLADGKIGWLRQDVVEEI